MNEAPEIPYCRCGLRMHELAPGYFYCLTHDRAATTLKTDYDKAFEANYRKDLERWYGT